MTEEYRLKYISAKNAREVLECLDYENVDIEKIIDFIKEKGVKKMNDKTEDERFSKEVKIVEKYIEENPGVSYRNAVLICLDKTEPDSKKEYTEEEKQFIEKQKGDLKKVEEYLESHPKVEYRTAILTILDKDELTENQKKVEDYIQKRKSQGIEVTYSQAVLACLDSSEEPKKEE